MLKRIAIFTLCLALIVLLVYVIYSCNSKKNSEISVLTDVKGIPASTKSDIGTNNGGSTGNTDNNGDTNQGSTENTDSKIIINTSSKKIHLSDECGYTSSIKESNKLVKSRDELDSYLGNGYSICSNCNKKYQNID